MDEHRTSACTFAGTLLVLNVCSSELKCAISLRHYGFPLHGWVYEVPILTWMGLWGSSLRGNPIYLFKLVEKANKRHSFGTTLNSLFIVFRYVIYSVFIVKTNVPLLIRFWFSRSFGQIFSFICWFCFLSIFNIYYW